MRTDSERLEWLENRCASLHCNFTTPEAWTCTPYGAYAEELTPSDGLTLRSAIDAAMDSEGK